MYTVCGFRIYMCLKSGGETSQPLKAPNIEVWKIKRKIGETNETYERYVFNKCDQQQGQSFDSYLTALRSLIKTCNFGTLQDNLLRDRVVLGIQENSTRKKLLAESKLALEKCISICRANETTSKQLK